MAAQESNDFVNVVGIDAVGGDGVVAGGLANLLGHGIAFALGA